MKTVQTGAPTHRPAASVVPFDGSGSGSPETDVQAELDRLEGLVAGADVEVDDEGTPLTMALASLDFVGAGVTDTVVGDDVTVTIPGGVTDHGGLTGLADDDHPQYTTNAEAIAIADAVKGLPLGLTGATAATRYVGATTSGAPVAGTFAVGDFIIDQAGFAWVCTVAGTPGTWVKVGGGGNTVGQLIVGFDAGAFTIVPGKEQDIVAPFDGTITGWEILSNVSGSCVVDIWSTVYGSFPPTVSDAIINTGAGGVKPTLSGAVKAQSASVANWTTAVTAGDTLRFHLDSISGGINRFLLVVNYSRP